VQLPYWRVRPRRHARRDAAAGRRHHPHRRRARGRPGALAPRVRRRRTAAVVRAHPRSAAGRDCPRRASAGHARRSGRPRAGLRPAPAARPHLRPEQLEGGGRVERFRPGSAAGALRQRCEGRADGRTGVSRCSTSPSLLPMAGRPAR
jgi:hypothetical protein